jgi:L-ascorbate metabolism protein UlaG (beta-lactamase superfamily)
MTKIDKVILFTIALLAISNFGFSQSNEIKIRFIGNCGLYLTDEKSNLYVDFPYKSGAHNYMKYDLTEIDSIKENSIFLFTHRHADHYSKKLLKQVKNRHKGKSFGSWNINKFGILNNTFTDFKIEIFKTKHRFTFKHYSYLITWHGKKIYLSGDTESAETIATVKNINWAFVPTWIILDARDKNLTIDADKIGVYHLYPNEKVTNSKPETYHILNKQGEEIIIPY